MKILLSYSKLHFDPLKTPNQHKHWASSASILARSLFSELEKIGSVTYIDAFNDEYKEISGNKYDLFVGIFNNFENIFHSCTIKKSVFFAVNMHFHERNIILTNFINNEKIPKSAVSDWDFMNDRELKSVIQHSSYILCVGNTAVYNSYILNGVPRTKIKMINYSVGSAKPQKKDRAYQANNFVYIATDASLRKGFDIVNDIFTDPAIIKNNFHLSIIGGKSNSYYKNKISRLKNLLGEKLTVFGWIDSNSDEYSKILSKNNFLIFPTLEEGQAGTVLDGIRHGIIPIISNNSGIDFSPLGVFELKLNSSNNKQLIIKALSTSANERMRLAEKSIDYYQLFHNNTSEVIKDSICDILNGNLYPKISIVLPIFNKEKVILPLIKKLDKACKAYKNCELIIIFDGCKDGTENKVRKYFSRNKKYNVRFYVTPNIFEVKSNNFGIKKSRGKYCVILQDDIFINDSNTFLEAISFMEKSSDIAILGCLAGVNYYPRNMKKLKGSGQIAQSKHEVYWRQDSSTDPLLKNRFFEVDACMRGPLIIRKDYLEKYGYFDEIYAPLYQDDMDLAFRAKKNGYRVFCGLFDVENRSFTMANYDEKRNKFFEKIIARNTDIFYKRWKPSVSKDYLWVHRVHFKNNKIEIYRNKSQTIKLIIKSRTTRGYGKARNFAGIVKKSVADRQRGKNNDQ